MRWKEGGVRDGVQRVRDTSSPCLSPRAHWLCRAPCTPCAACMHACAGGEGGQGEGGSRGQDQGDGVQGDQRRREPAGEGRRAQEAQRGPQTPGRDCQAAGGGAAAPEAGARDEGDGRQRKVLVAGGGGAGQGTAGERQARPLSLTSLFHTPFTRPHAHSCHAHACMRTLSPSCPSSTSTSLLLLLLLLFLLLIFFFLTPCILPLPRSSRSCSKSTRARRPRSATCRSSSRGSGRACWRTTESSRSK